MDRKTDQRVFAMLQKHGEKLLKRGVPVPNSTDQSCNEWIRHTEAFSLALDYTAQLSPEALGALAAAGGWHDDELEETGQIGTSLYSVHRCAYLGKYESGIYNLRRLAVTALVAYLYDFVKQAMSHNRQAA